MLRELVNPERPLDVPATILDLDPSLDLVQRAHKVCKCDDRAGWPPLQPGVVESHSPGFCAPQHRVVLAHQLSEATQCVVELGAWLGMICATLRTKAVFTTLGLLLIQEL